ncbi:nuclease-related domain-containing protein [Sporanaerobacter acetigenes]|uniref:Nuclease-related domain-containing protein n=1 Tax=Sporanaerobacter acetigenes DSM 13106 TaxID=1123281 RepID=A0A1M5U615_9FIRM|nr:nuclease-related domain-containing protein [Sporanaerobacter acetigenes]SHH58389.1 Nuclease-related domain-containing protein [Sporanaerobacter acetigenes DSM 13106]
MAQMFPPSIKGFTNENYSEIELYMFLKYALPDNYYVFWNIRVENHYPDFIILEPKLGLIILEVKAWKLGTISSANAKNYHFKPNNEIKINPLEQARGYTNDLSNFLKKEKRLCQSDGLYKGNLKFCYTYGVVFTNITKEDFLNSIIYESINERFILFKDEIEHIENKQDLKLLKQKFKNMFVKENSFNFNPLSQDDIELIKKVLYKENTLPNDESSEEEENIEIKNCKPPVEAIPVKKEKLSIKKLVIKILTIYWIISLIILSLNLCIGLYTAYKKDISRAASKFITKFNNKLEIFTQNKTNKYVESKPIMTFKVGSHPGSKGTFILIKDGKKHLVNKIFTEGSIIEFYNNKKVVILDSKSDKKEFNIENDIIDLEVGNTYTKIYLQDKEHKYIKDFKYDFVNKVISEIKK